MIGETLSPARAGRSTRSFGSGGGSASIQVWPIVGAADEAVEQIEGLGHDVVARHRLELRHIDAAPAAVRSQSASGVGGPPGRAVSASRVSKTIVPPFFMKAAMRVHRLGVRLRPPATIGQ